MKIEILYLEQLQFEKVSYYTVRVVGKAMTEFDEFQKKFNVPGKNKDQLAEINRFIKTMGNDYGALDQYFKREGYAERLPPPYYRFVESDGETDFGLRLYCIRLTDEVVILLNGCRKTAQAVKNCSNCFEHFQLANQISDAIYAAMQNGEIEIDGFDLLTDEDFVLDIKQQL